jgi:DNA-binding GntR family transcriptional regulator
MKRIKIPSDLTSLAYNNIKQHILEGRLHYDSRLTEAMLSKQLGISRSPIREALNSLEKEGLIRIEPRKGAFLRRFSIKEVGDLYDLRKILEISAVQTVRVTPKLVADLEKSVERIRGFLKENRKDAFISEDMWFHNSIAIASGNLQLCMVLENVQNQIWLCRCHTYSLSSSTAPRAHGSIVEALKQGDHTKATDAMGTHIEYVRQQLIYSLHRQQSSRPTIPEEGALGLDQSSK